MASLLLFGWNMWRCSPEVFKTNRRPKLFEGWRRAAQGGDATWRTFYDGMDSHLMSSIYIMSILFMIRNIKIIAGIVTQLVLATSFLMTADHSRASLPTVHKACCGAILAEVQQVFPGVSQLNVKRHQTA